MARRPQKRRRVSRASSPASGTDSTCTVLRASPPVLPLDAFTFPLPDASDLSCVTCHRALGSNSGTDAKQSQLVVCPRCRATSCAICSRACTVIPPSAPPTPLLSYSPSPPGTPLGPAEDRELPLEFDSDGTPSARVHALQVRRGESTTRRRRYSEIVEDDDERTVVGGEEDAYGNSNKAVAVDDALPGCGRVLCKNCCVENIQTGGTTCYDCYGLPSPTHDRQSAAPLSKSSSANPSMTSLLI